MTDKGMQQGRADRLRTLWGEAITIAEARAETWARATGQVVPNSCTWSLDPEDAILYGAWYDFRCSSNEEFSIPLSALVLSDTEFAAFAAKVSDERQERKEREKAEAKAKQDRLQDLEDRRTYERLKKKIEGAEA